MSKKEGENPFVTVKDKVSKKTKAKLVSESRKMDAIEKKYAPLTKIIESRLKQLNNTMGWKGRVGTIYSRNGELQYSDVLDDSPTWSIEFKSGKIRNLLNVEIQEGEPDLSKPYASEHYINRFSVKFSFSGPNSSIRTYSNDNYYQGYSSDTSEKSLINILKEAATAYLESQH